MAFLALVYAVFPFDFLPDLLVGWGWLDDIIVLGLVGYLYFWRTKKAAGSWQTGGPKASEESRGRTGPSASHAPGAGGDARQDPYSILGVNPGASQKDIRAAYRRLAARYHPDRHAHLGDEFRLLAENKFKAIQAAYDALRNR